MSGEVKQNASVASGAIGAAATATESASNPTQSENPESVGAEWHNTTSGQIFICTDNTASANFWIGQRGKNIVGSRCLFAGGNTDNADEHQPGVSINEISYVVPSTLGDATDFGDLLYINQYFSGTSNGTNERGIFAGGSGDASPTDMIQYVNCSSAGNATDFGNMTAARSTLGACSNGTSDRATFSGGTLVAIPPQYDRTTNIIDYITISTTGNATDFGDLTISRDYTSSTDNGTNDRGINAGGRLDGGSSGNTNRIDYWTISTTANAQDFGDLTAARFRPWSTSNDTNNRGLFGGGEVAGVGSYSNIIEYITISSTGNGTDFGDMDGATPSGYNNYNGGRDHSGATSSGTGERGMYAGGYTSGGGVQDWYAQIEYVTISTTGNSTAFGNLAKRVYGPAACSNTAG